MLFCIFCPLHSLRGVVSCACLCLTSFKKVYPLTNVQKFPLLFRLFAVFFSFLILLLLNVATSSKNFFHTNKQGIRQENWEGDSRWCVELEGPCNNTSPALSLPSLSTLCLFHPCLCCCTHFLLNNAGFHHRCLHINKRAHVF
uniref:T. congolense-specific, cell surface-expressed gene family n=1 Tax=Trypanosoma congolense (strain IL3000) TaxID=1068625 RepID=G0V2Y3_TRYCI|nr:hypothetical protein, unlikely [Trypanosoma congolense IL3000]